MKREKGHGRIYRLRALQTLELDVPSRRLTSIDDEKNSQLIWSLKQAFNLQNLFSFSVAVRCLLTVTNRLTPVLSWTDTCLNSSNMF